MDEQQYGCLVIKVMAVGLKGESAHRRVFSKECVTLVEAETMAKEWREHNPSLVTTTFAEWRAYAQCI